VPLAVPTFGINHADMDQICLGNGQADDSLFGAYDPDLMVRCKIGYDALEILKSRAADAVMTVSVMKRQQLTFRAQMLDSMEETIRQVSSVEFTKWLMGFKNSEKIGKYTERLEALLADILQSGDARQKLIDAMGAIEASVSRLSLALNEKVPILREYVESCGRPALAVSTMNDYLLDVCNQNTNACMDDVEAQHVGCCCGSLPATGFFDIPADTSGRRLTTQINLGMDVCFEAAARAKTDVDRLTAELKASSAGSQLLSNFDATMEKQYPTWSGGCAERRRLQEVSVGGSALSEVSEGASAPGGQLRELQDSPLLSCSPPTSATVQTSEVMKVAFSADTEKDYCGDLTTSTGEANSTAQKILQLASPNSAANSAARKLCLCSSAASTLVSTRALWTACASTQTL